MNDIRVINRRDFLGNLVGAGAFILGAPLLSKRLSAQDAAANATWEPDLFLAIESDGTAVILAHRSEMGTGIRTCLPMIVADELDADWDRIRIEQAIGDAKLGDQNTDGSRSIIQFYDKMRQVGASARAMLLSAAAKRFAVPVSECRTDKHRVIHTKTDRVLDYSALVAWAPMEDVPDVESLTFKKPEDYRYIGKPMPITDLKELCNGQGVFGVDAQMPGMVYAVIERSPVLGGTLKSHDDGETLQVPGVLETVVLPSFTPPHNFQALGGIAVIASNTWAAIKGRKALKADWEAGANGTYDSDKYKDELLATVRKPGKVVRDEGAFDDAYAKAAQKHQAEYYAPHLAHAPMEPPMAVAHFDNGKVIAHAPTQNPQAVQQAVAGALQIPLENVECHVTLLGGGFGRKSKPDYVVEDALLSRELGKPVKVVWTREDDIQFDYFHSVAAMRLEAGLDGNGKPTALLHRSAFPTITSTFAAGSTYGAPFEVGMGLTNSPYAIPNHRAENGPAANHVRIGWLRAVCNNFHAFSLCSFMDELAHLASSDPKGYLLDALGEPRVIGDPNDPYAMDTGRLAQVIELAAEKSGWSDRPKGDGKGFGIAAHYSFRSYIAAVVSIEVDDGGNIAIPRVDLAIDAGIIINPDRVVSQMEGAAVFGTSLALFGEITAKEGKIEQSNYDGYRVARMAEAPKEVHVHIVPSEAPPAGVGEPGVPPMAPAIANAYFVATGERVRDLPMVKAG